MAQTIKNANIFGRIGSSFGKGLADQLPEEIAHHRLQSGLRQFEQDAPGLDPVQLVSRAAGIKGIRPQTEQSLGEVAKQQARGNALANFQAQQQQPNPFPQGDQPAGNEPPSDRPSHTNEEDFSKVQEGYIPPTKDEEFARAGKLYKEDPERFGNDPQRALDHVAAETDRNQAIADAYQTRHQNLEKIQDNVVKRLGDQYNKLNGGNPRIPSELYSDIEDQAIRATKSKAKGGRGLTEQQAIKEYGDKLHDAEKAFTKIDEIGDWGITQRPAAETLRTMKNVQGVMEKLDQTDNYAKELISKNKLSPEMAFSIAEPVSRVPEVNGFIKGLAKLEDIGTARNNYTPDNAVAKTLEIAPELARLIKDNPKASPLAIAHEIRKKGYDPQTWLQYVTDNAKKLNLKERQTDQASTPLNAVTPWNDWWLQSFTGIE